MTQSAASRARLLPWLSHRPPDQEHQRYDQANVATEFSGNIRALEFRPIRS
jgi:hypothetical protein